MSSRSLVLAFHVGCRLFRDDPATSARFPHLDPQNRSHAPPCQRRAPVRVGGGSAGYILPGRRVDSGSGTEYLTPSIREGIVSPWFHDSAPIRSPSRRLRVWSSVRCIPTRWPRRCGPRGHDESIKLNYGSLYTVVESLARRGLIEPREPERDGRRPERTVYAITEAGHTEFVDWLTELLGTPAKEYPQFEAGLTLMAGLPSADVVALLEERGKKLELEIARLASMFDVATRDGVPRVFLVEVEYERALPRGRARVHPQARCRHRVGRARRSGPMEGVPRGS